MGAMETDQSDRKLVLRLIRGDTEGLSVVVDKYWVPLVRFGATLGVDNDTAEDVAQESFVRLWEHRETLKLDGSLRGLLYRIARNVSIDKLRKGAARERAAAGVDASAEIPSPYEHVVKRELHSIIDAAIEALPQRRREVFLLVRCHGLSHREVAATLGLKPQTVANHLGMALADLRVLLAPYLPDYSCPSKPDCLRTHVRADRRNSRPHLPEHGKQRVQLV